MDRTRKLTLGLGVAGALLAGGVAVAAPALAQDETPSPADVDCPYECPYDGDGMRHEYRHGPEIGQHEHGLRDQARQGDQARQEDQVGERDQVRQRDRDGTCQLADGEADQS